MVIETDTVALAEGQLVTDSDAFADTDTAADRDSELLTVELVLADVDGRRMEEVTEGVADVLVELDASVETLGDPESDCEMTPEVDGREDFETVDEAVDETLRRGEGVPETVVEIDVDTRLETVDDADLIEDDDSEFNADADLENRGLEVVEVLADDRVDREAE